MAITVKNIIPRKQVENTQSAQYTAQGCKTIIDKFTVTNTGGTSIEFSVHLVAAGSSASNSNKVLSNRSISNNETYTCPELIGQSLEPGGFISTVANGNTLTISATGREIT